MIYQVSAMKLSRDKVKNIIENIHPDDNGCKLWPHSLNGGGYGSAYFDRKHHSIHRLSYELFKGKIIVGNIICHTCDIPRCVNPSHLYSGNHADNYKDAVERGLIKKKPGPEKNYIPQHRYIMNIPVPIFKELRNCAFNRNVAMSKYLLDALIWRLEQEEE